jgi:long-chain acyl-CoA synthetase
LSYYPFTLWNASPNWQLIAHACASISTPIATAYDTLGEEGLTHSLNEPSCIGLFTNAELLPTVLKVLPKTPSIKYVVYDGDAKQSILDDIRGVRDIKVFSITELRDLGRAKPLEPLEARRPKPDTMACIMYTSGSTGNPKGVCITHSNLVASVGAVYTLLGHHLTYEDSYLAYLPLAHVLEYIVELIMLFVGMPSGYGRVKTLTDTSVRGCKGDMNAFRPSVMVGVPAVWETIRKGILGKVNGGGAIKKTMFNGAMAAKKNRTPILSQLADSVVLSSVRAATGGRLRIAMSGGAAISRETQEFLNIALVTVVQGARYPFLVLRIIDLYFRLWYD